MGQQDLNLYFIALVPEEPLFSTILSFKNDISNRFNSKAALRSPPHITLHMPFRWKEQNEGRLFTPLQSLATSSPSFNIDLKNFGCFEPRVIYVSVQENQWLVSIQERLLKIAATEWHIYQQRNSRPFRPHMTIAFRDLKKNDFYKAWDEYKIKSLEAIMITNHLTLLKHNGRNWDIHKQFLLQEKSSKQ